MDGMKLIVFFLIVHCEDLTFSCKFIIFQIFIIGGLFVNQTVWGQFHNAVGDCLNKLMIMGSKKNNSRKFDYSVV